MTVATQACPFCNAAVPGSGSAGRRLTCPRCGETFAPRNDAISDVAPLPPAGVTVTPAPEVDRYLGRQPDARGSNRRLAIVVIAIMVVMASGGLTLALLTQAQRRANDAGLPGKMKSDQAGFEADKPPPAPLPADQSPLMGYVPEGTNVLLGVHLAEMREDPLAAELLHKEIAVAGQKVPLDLTAWTGLGAEDVDYALLTATLTPNLIADISDFRLALLLRTHRPVDETKVIERLQASKEVVGGTNDVTWRFRPRGQKIDWSLRFVDPHTLALGIIPNNLMAVPTKPRVGLGHLSTSLRKALQRIETGGVIWVATNVNARTRDRYFGQVGAEGKDKPSPFKTVQTLAAWVRPGTPYTLSAAFDCADRDGAEKLEGYLAGLAPDLHEPDLKFAIDDKACLSVQRRADQATILQAIDKGLKR